MNSWSIIQRIFWHFSLRQWASSRDVSCNFVWNNHCNHTHLVCYRAIIETARRLASNKSEKLSIEFLKVLNKMSKVSTVLGVYFICYVHICLNENIAMIMNECIFINLIEGGEGSGACTLALHFIFNVFGYNRDFNCLVYWLRFFTYRNIEHCIWIINQAVAT